MSYDPKCYELAKAFLSDEPNLDTEDNRESLAQDIKNEIEHAIESMRFVEGMRP